MLSASGLTSLNSRVALYCYRSACCYCAIIQHVVPSKSLSATLCAERALLCASGSFMLHKVRLSINARVGVSRAGCDEAMK